MNKFITIGYFKQLVQVDASIEDSFINRAIEQCQFMYLKPLLGSKYTELEQAIPSPTPSQAAMLDVIAPYVAYTSAQCLLRTVTTRIGNSGFTKPQSQNATPENQGFGINIYKELSNRALRNIRDYFWNLDIKCDGDLFTSSPSCSINC